MIEQLGLKIFLYQSINFLFKNVTGHILSSEWHSCTEQMVYDGHFFEKLFFDENYYLC